MNAAMSIKVSKTKRVLWRATVKTIAFWNVSKALGRCSAALYNNVQFSKESYKIDIKSRGMPL